MHYLAVEGDPGLVVVQYQVKVVVELVGIVYAKVYVALPVVYEYVERRILHQIPLGIGELQHLFAALVGRYEARGVKPVVRVEVLRRGHGVPVEPPCLFVLYRAHAREHIEQVGIAGAAGRVAAAGGVAAAAGKRRGEQLGKHIGAVTAAAHIPEQGGEGGAGGAGGELAARRNRGKAPYAVGICVVHAYLVVYIHHAVHGGKLPVGEVDGNAVGIGKGLGYPVVLYAAAQRLGKRLRLRRSHIVREVYQVYLVYARRELLCPAARIGYHGIAVGIYQLDRGGGELIEGLGHGSRKLRKVYQ